MGVNLGMILENPEGRGSYGKSLPWGWYGYSLEPHIVLIVCVNQFNMYHDICMLN